jgi:hypothetical protein
LIVGALDIQRAFFVGVSPEPKISFVNCPLTSRRKAIK